MSIVTWNKKYTETLFETLERFRLKYSEYQDSKITYAGRLDPMAEGLMILLIDDDVHRKDEFIKLDKVYEVDFILGVCTDTYDILGLVNNNKEQEIIENNVKKQIAELENITSQEYPAYSSKTVNGKALWQWARERKLSEINTPRIDISIFDAKYIGLKLLSKTELQDHILKSIKKVSGDFRQKEIMRLWNNYFLTSKRTSYQIYTMRVHASSGTYMRSLVHTIGKKTGIGATTVRINRIQVGEYLLT